MSKPQDTPDPTQWVGMFQADKAIMPRAVTGRFARWRWAMVGLTQLIFYGVPWLQYHGRQALLLNLEQRQFFIGPWLFYPQDFIYLTGLLVVCALSLFLFTAVAGRLWCGYACPQTVYTELFMALERWTEGDRAARLRLHKSPWWQGLWPTHRLGRSMAKHTLWLMLASYTGFTFVGYFTPIRELGHLLINLQLGPWQQFWIVFYSLATYGNAGFMREQVCKYMCPYARFQSAMFDQDTLLITYDSARGEPRGPRGKTTDPKPLGLGACIDCGLCVQVCPTGIDIRKGLQYECIGCAACIDACDGIMQGMGYAPGLVKYSTQNALQKGWGWPHMKKRALRPRVLLYTAVVWSLIVGLVLAIERRPNLKVDIVRDRSINHRMTDDGRLENVYRVLLMNPTEYPLEVRAFMGGVYTEGRQARNAAVVLQETGPWVLQPTENRWVVVHIQAKEGVLPQGSHRLSIDWQGLSLGGAEVGTVRSTKPRSRVVEEAVFLVGR